MTRFTRLLFVVFWLAHSAAMSQPPARTYQFIITELPENTPHDARLFLTGNFTKWNPANPACQFKKLPDGTHQLTIQSALPRLEFKVTRGNWPSVEGREGGRARANRTLTAPAGPGHREIELAIMSWEDLSGTFHFYSVYDLLILFSAFQALLLLLAIPGIQDYNRSANRWLVLLLGLTAVVLFVRTVSAYRDVAQTYTKLLLVPDLVLFLYAPLFYIYLRKLLFSPNRSASGWWRHFVPALVQVGCYLPYVLSNSKLFQIKIVNRDPWLMALFVSMGLLGLLYNAIYWWFCRRAIRTYQAQHQQNLSTESPVQYLNTVLLLQAVCLGVWVFFFGLLLGSRLFDLDSLTILDKSVDLIWLTFASIVYLLGYYAIHQPEIFKLPDTERIPLLESDRPGPLLATLPAVQVAPATGLGTLPVAMATCLAVEPGAPSDTALALRQQIDQFMKRQKPYTDPNLTLAELALRLRIPPHVLSKTLNDTYQQNFFDFINQHRILELKARLTDPRFRSYTLLSMAHEVGFNSKTAFNRSFKKLTNQTPSEYVQMQEKGANVLE